MTPAILFISGFLTWLGLCLLLWAIVRGGSHHRAYRREWKDTLRCLREGKAAPCPCLMQEDGQPLMWMGTEVPGETPLDGLPVQPMRFRGPQDFS